MINEYRKLFEERFPFIDKRHFNELMDSLTQPHRCLHSLDFHIGPMVDKILNFDIGEYQKEERRDKLLLLAFYHDACYIPLAEDNEIQSGVMFCTHVYSGNLPKDKRDLCMWVHEKILQTKNHNFSEYDKAWNYFIKLDYGPLMDSEGFCLNEAELRFYKEFMDYDSFDRIKAGRIRFLADLLSREPMFFKELDLDYVYKALHFWTNAEEKNMYRLLKVYSLI